MSSATIFVTPTKSIVHLETNCIIAKHCGQVLYKFHDLFKIWCAAIFFLPFQGLFNPLEQALTWLWHLSMASMTYLNTTEWRRKIQTRLHSWNLLSNHSKIAIDKSKEDSWIHTYRHEVLRDKKRGYPLSPLLYTLKNITWCFLSREVQITYPI